MQHTRPVAGIGAVVIHNDQVLLVKRAKAPKKGLWCIPGGKITYGETLQQAAEREIKEETGVTIKAGVPIYVFDLIIDTEYHYIIIDLIAEYISGTPKAGDDASDAKWISLHHLDDPNIDTETRQLLFRYIQREHNLL